MRKHARAARRIPLAAAVAAILAAAPPSWAAQTYVVNTCSDPPLMPACEAPFDGTLRMAYRCAQDGDVIDLTRLRCGTISLRSELSNGTATGLELKGPGRDKLVLDGGGAHRVLRGIGKLTVSELSIERGRFQLTQDTQGGGCIAVDGSVHLMNVRVSDCTLIATDDASARGGGIYAAGPVDLQSSIVSGSSASSDTHAALGGGVYAGSSVSLTFSTISGNSAHAAESAVVSAGGGLYSPGRNGVGHVIYNSTLSGNSAGAGAAAYLSGAGQAVLFNSTVAGNHVVANGAGRIASALDASNLDLLSSTFAGNQFDGGAGFDVNLAAGTVSHLVNVILADGITTASTELLGNHNLIRHSNPQVVLPVDTLTTDPMLGELRPNGGPTLTMMPRSESPAIGAGHALSDADQRGAPRHAMSATDIGAVDSDSLFYDGFDLPHS